MRKLKYKIFKDAKIIIKSPTEISYSTFINCHISYENTLIRDNNSINESIFIDKHPDEAYFIGHD